MPLTIHLIPNAHLDPVWLWDWREGMNEGITTTRTILDLMDEDPELTFIRGEAAQYAFMREHDPATFARVKKYIEQGRWDAVGGTWIQPDTNLPATEIMARHLAVGQNWFIKHLGRPTKVAWTADSFGHSAGLPEIYAQAGITGLAFTRPSNKIAPIAKPAFWWQAASGARIMCFRPPAPWYGTERSEISKRLDITVQNACGLENAGCFIGLGNHGGGPTRRHLADVRAWAKAHPEVTVKWSGLHTLFAALFDEVKRKGDDHLPTHHGELNYCLRGCYSSVAKFKFQYRRAENLVTRAERTDAAICAALDTKPQDFSEEWQSVLFNSFHDILPGTSIERAFDDQSAWLGIALHGSSKRELHALNKLAHRGDSSVEQPPFDHPSAVAALVWNPHPYPYRGHIEIEAQLDYRMLWGYADRYFEVPVRLKGTDGQPLPLQKLRRESDAMARHPWRYRVIAPVSLPAFGWNVLEFGWVEGHTPPDNAGTPATAKDGVIDNGFYRVEAKAGAKGLRIERQGKAVFQGDGFGVVTVADRLGSWGSLSDEGASPDHSTVVHDWKVTLVEVREQGPERAALSIRLEGGKSRLDLNVRVTRNRDAVDVQARLFLDERSARVKLVMPVGAELAEFEVPGAVIERGPAGEVPGGRWVRTRANGGFVFASDSLYNYDLKDGVLRATVARASYYANDDVDNDPDKNPFRPSVDCGELRFAFVFAPGDSDPSQISRELEEPPQVLLIAPRKGDLGRSGTLAALAPSSLRLLALKGAEDGRGYILRVQEMSGKSADATLTWLGTKLALGSVKGASIATWRLTQSTKGWSAEAVDIVERKI
jgi:alpha-mannosidase